MLLEGAVLGVMMVDGLFKVEEIDAVLFVVGVLQLCVSDALNGAKGLDNLVAIVL